LNGATERGEREANSDSLFFSFGLQEGISESFSTHVYVHIPKGREHLEALDDAKDADEAQHLVLPAVDIYRLLEFISCVLAAQLRD